jgi:rod shape determining protein RodA
MHLRRWQQFDLPLMLIVLALVLYGVAVIHSATCLPKRCNLLEAPLSSWAMRQMAYAVVGLLILLMLTVVDYRVFRAVAYPSFAFSIFCLVVVLLIGRGQEEYGARRWIPLGFFDFQPSEVTKVTMILALARWLGINPDKPPGLRRVIASGVFVVLPLWLIYLEPDLGTAIAYVVIWFGMLAAAGVRPRHLAGILLAGGLTAPLGWFYLRDYMRQRIQTFLLIYQDPEKDIFGEGYNILQARISIGSGGFWGRGFTQGTQNQFEYLRVKHSDFIFSVLAEELGFLGALALFCLFIFLIFRLVRASERARDPFGRLVAFGVACMLFFQSVVNLGANLTVLPVTGIPLPLVSFGGSALITNFVALGLVQSILVRRLKYRY